MCPQKFLIFTLISEESNRAFLCLRHSFIYQKQETP